MERREGEKKDEEKGSRCQEAHWSEQPYARLSPTVHSICSSSDAHPYVRAVCVSACDCVFLSSSYRGIQHQHSGEAASHHWLGGGRPGLPHRRGRHYNRVQPVSQSRPLLPPRHPPPLVSLPSAQSENSLKAHAKLSHGSFSRFRRVRQVTSSRFSYCVFHVLRQPKATVPLRFMKAAAVVQVRRLLIN